MRSTDPRRLGRDCCWDWNGYLVCWPWRASWCWGGGQADQSANQMEIWSPSSSVWSCQIWGGCPFWEGLIWRAELQQLTLETAKAPEFVVDIGPRDSLCSQCNPWQSSHHCCQLLSCSSGTSFWKSWPISLSSKTKGSFFFTTHLSSHSISSSLPPSSTI